MEAGADLQQAADAASDFSLACGWCRDAAQDLQQRRLAGAVRADDAEDLTLACLERHVLEGPDLLAWLMHMASAKPPHAVNDRVAKSPIRRAQLTDLVLLRQA